jgi:hypothetical protein
VGGFLLAELRRQLIPLGGRTLKLRAQVVHLPLELLDMALVRCRAVGEVGLEPIPLGCGLLQPVSQILKMRSTLLEELFELLLRGEAALKRRDLTRGFVEFSLDAQHPLARVGRLGLRGRLGIGAG